MPAFPHVLPQLRKPGSARQKSASKVNRPTLSKLATATTKGNSPMPRFLRTLLFASALVAPGTVHCSRIPSALLLFGEGIPRVAAISPDGTRVIVTNDGNGGKGIFANVMDVSSSRRLDLTRYKFINAAWGEDSNTIYAHDDSGTLLRVRLDKNEDPIPVRVQGVAKWQAILYPRIYSPYLYVKSHVADHPVYRCEAANQHGLWSNCQLVANESVHTTGFVFSTTGELVARTANSPNEGPRFQKLDRYRQWQTIVSAGPLATLRTIGFLQSDRTIWALSDGNGEYETVSLVRLDIDTGTETVYHANDRFDLRSAAVTRNGTPLFAEYEKGYPTIEFFHSNVRKAFDALLRLTGKPVSVRLVSHDYQARFLTVRVFSEKTFDAHFIIDLAESTARQLSVNPLQRFRDSIPSSRPVRIKARDGLPIFGFLAMPPRSDAPPPMVLKIHGGPWQREVWNASGTERFFATRGYAVLRLNYRGSIGYGRSYTDAGIGEVFGAIRYDVRDAARWAVSMGHADPKAIFLLGESFGGYLALLELSDNPNLYAGGIAINPVADPETFWQREWRRKHYRPAWQTLFRSEQFPEQQFARYSPIRNFSRISDPLLLFTSREDRRVPPAATRKLYQLLRASGKSLVRHFEYRGVGHDISTAHPALVVHMHETMEKFLKEAAKLEPSKDT